MKVNLFSYHRLKNKSQWDIVVLRYAIVWILLSLLFLPGILAGCNGTSTEDTPLESPMRRTDSVMPAPTQASVLSITFSPTLTASPTPTIQAPTQTFITATSMATALLSTPSEKPITPGIYPVYWKEGAAYIVLPSGETQELMHLYDQPVYVSDSGHSITYLDNDSRDTIPSPNGQIIAYLNLEDRLFYTYDIFSKVKLKIPQPQIIDFYSGSWSPDGKYLVYAINDDPLQGFPSVFVADIAKNTYARITDWSGLETTPVWSPDGQWLAYASDKFNAGLEGGRYTGVTDIYVARKKCVVKLETCADSFITQLTHTGTKGIAIDPMWNPDSTNLAYIYADWQTSGGDIYLVDLNGNIKNLTNSPEADEDAFSWSPDGKEIVFRRDGYSAGTDIFILNLSDGTTTQITNSSEIREGIPFWSPDGSEIAFDENVDSSNSGIAIYSVKEKQWQPLEGSNGGKFLFWLTVFPEISNGATLTVSPSGHNLNIRSEASINASVIGKLQSGDTFTILDQPVENGQYTWWKIKSEQGEGWIAQNYNWVLPNPKANP